jgi:Ca2+-binding EF-hand superfamily protein
VLGSYYLQDSTFVIPSFKTVSVLFVVGESSA